MPKPTGKVYLVGAGPGDPALLTLRGRELLCQADVVYFDYLVNPLMLEGLEDTTELVCLGRHGQGRILSQEETNALMISAAQAGRTVVRLKGGDPAIFGRAAEETAALEAAGVPYELVPGITAAMASGSYAGIPLTHREWSSCVAFVTGQECRDKQGQPLDWAGLARFPGTLVFYMGVTTAPAWAGELLAHGKPADTPLALIRRCSHSDQQVVKSTLGDLPEVLAANKIRPPAIVILGEVVRAQATTNWFASRPLFGQTVLVTRPSEQSDAMVARLEALGARALRQPAIEISAPAEWSQVDRAIDHLASYDWLVFSSANGVRFFLDRILQRGGDMRQLGHCRLASIGPATARELAGYHLHSDLQPQEYRAEALAEQLATGASGQRFLLLRASRGREVLAETLKAAGGMVEQVVVYESRDVVQAKSEVAAALAGGQIDWITVTSSAIARSLVQLFGEDLRQAKLAAISPLTAEVLSAAGYSPAVVAMEYTTKGLLEAVLQRGSTT